MSEGYQIVEKKAIGEVRVRLPFSLEELLEGLAFEIEELSGEAGLLIMKAIIDQEVEDLAGRRYKRSSNRRAFRWGSQPGYVLFAGRKADIERPRVRDRRGKEVELRTYSRFQRRGKMQDAVLGKVVRGVSSRDYEGAIEELCEGYGIKRSSVSRHLIQATREKLAELCERPLGDLSLCAILVDGLE